METWPELLWCSHDHPDCSLNLFPWLRLTHTLQSYETKVWWESKWWIFFHGKFFLQGHSKSDFPVLFLGFLRMPELWFSDFLNSQAPGVGTGRHSALTCWGCCCELSVLRAQHSWSSCLTFWAKDWDGEEGTRPTTNEGICTWALCTLEKHLLMCLPGNPSWR